MYNFIHENSLSTLIATDRINRSENPYEMTLKKFMKLHEISQIPFVSF